MYKSTNEGEYWDSIAIAAHPYVTNPICVIADPNKAWTVYIGKNPTAPDDHCVWKSEDGGLSWNYRDQGITNPNPLCFAMHPTSPGILFAGFNQAGGTACLYKTTDGGILWTDIDLTPLNELTVYDLAVVADIPYSVYVAAGGGTADCGFYLSTDNGNSFQRTLVAEVRAVAYDGTNPLHVWEGEIISDRAGVRQSTNGGLAWSLPVLLPQGTSITSLAVTAPNRIYAATDCGVYLSTDGGLNWSAMNNGIYIRQGKVIIANPSNNQILYFGAEVAIYRTSDGGQTWVEKTRGMHNAFTVGISTRSPDAIYVLGISTVHNSPDQGLSWMTIDNGATYGSRYYIAADPTDGQRAFHVGETFYDINYVRRTTNAGLSWTNLFQGINATYTSIAVDPVNGQNVYLAFRDPSPTVYGLQKSTDGGNSWFNMTPGNDIVSITVDKWQPQTVYAGSGIQDAHIYKTTNGGTDWYTYDLPATGECMVFDICSNSLANKVYTRISGQSAQIGLYKSKDGGVTWSACGFLGQDMAALVMDCKEPEILYTGGTGNQGLTYLTVDGGAVWIAMTNQLPSDVADLAMDINQPNAVYAATQYGVYVNNPQYLNKHLTSSSPEATGINNGRKMLCGTSDIWLTYESGGVIYAVHSSDAGNTWSRKMEIGQGYNPAIAANPHVATPLPGIVWWVQGTRDTVYFSRYLSDDDWTAPFPIATTDNNFGPPSFVIGTDDMGRIVFSHTYDQRIDYAEFDVYDPVTVSNPEDVGAGTNPSIGFMIPARNNPEIHITWQNNNWIKYRTRTIQGTWNQEETVYNSYSQNPSIEVAGTNVYFVWKMSSSIGYRFTRYRNNGVHTWSGITGFMSDYDLNYPVLTGASAMSCVADLDGSNTEIFFYYNPGLSWLGPFNMSNTIQRSYCPHIVHRQTIFGTVVHFIWTENDDPAYDIRFANYNIGGYDSGEDLAFYAAQGGDTLASPFNLKRAGFLHFGAEPYKHVDYDNQYLEYEFSCLDPDKDYALAAHAYQEGYTRLLLTLKIDNIQITGINLPPETLITYKAMLPYSFYADSTINIKVYGNKAVSSAFVLHQYEKDQGEGGGPQDMGTIALGSDKPMLDLLSNPVQGEFTIRYLIPQATKVNISLYDVMGRLAGVLVNVDHGPGIYSKSFNTMNLPQGIYFVRLVIGANNDVVTKKAVFLSR